MATLELAWYFRRKRPTKSVKGGSYFLFMSDPFGPEHIVEVYDPRVGMRGFLVIDNTVLGPGKGGIRMTANVTKEEVFRLARTMTWKNALAGIPFGGAKAGMVWQGGSDELKKKHLQSFARAIKMFVPKYYIAGPDVNSGEKEMQWFVEATGIWRSATGKPANLCMQLFGKEGEKCGIPHEFGSTGFGVAKSAAVAAQLGGIDIKKATIAIHGFGNVGTFAWQHLTEMGATTVALADSDTALYKRDGLDKKIIARLIKEKKSLSSYPKSARIKNDAFWKMRVDILIPASVTDVIHAGNKNDIKAKIIVEGGNIPMSEKIEDEFFKKGVVIVPDFVANAGGVISSYAEYRGYNPKRMFDLVEKKIVYATKVVLQESLKKHKNPRVVAQEIAVKLVEARMGKRAV